jgi:ankyrin repeat protein
MPINQELIDECNRDDCDLKTVRDLLLLWEAEVNTEDEYGGTPLIYASSRGSWS